MVVNTKKYNELEIDKTTTIVAKLWIFFLQIHKKSPYTQKAAKSIFLLTEGLLRYTNIVLIADYIAYSRKHDESCHVAINEFITKKRNWNFRAIQCLEKIWPQECTFFDFFATLDKTKIITSFQTILEKSNTTKKPTKKEYEEFVKLLGNFIPLIRSLSEYKLTYYQDYPWQDSNFVTSPILSFTGTKPLSSLQCIKSNIYGTWEQFYLFNEKNCESLSLYPFIYTEEPESHIVLFSHFNLKSSKMEYMNYSSGKKESLLSKLLIQELNNICNFFNKPITSKPFAISLDNSFDRKNLYQPITQINNYLTIRNNSNLQKQFNLLMSLRELLVKFFVNSLLEKLTSSEMIKILTLLNLGDKVLLLKDKDIDMEKQIIQTLQELDDPSILTDELFDKLWNVLLKNKDNANIVFLLKVYSFYKIDLVIKYFSRLPKDSKEDAFLVVLSFLLSEDLHKESIKFFDALHEKIHPNLILNKEVICSLVQTFIKVSPNRCFEICEKFVHNLDVEWIDPILRALLNLSLSKTIALINKCGITDEKNYDNIKWQMWVKIYEILIDDKSLFSEFVSQVKEPIAHLRLKGILALKQNDLELFMKIISDASFSNNIEHIIGSLCFFIQHLKAQVFSNEKALVEKLIGIVNTYAHSLLDTVGSFHIKKECEKLMDTVHFGEIIKAQKELSKDEKGTPAIFNVFLSYLIANHVLDIESIKKYVRKIETGKLKHLEKTEVSLCEMMEFSDKNILEGTSFHYEYNIVNQLLTEIATIQWEYNKENALHYISQMVPDTLFDKEDAIKKLIVSTDIIFKDLEYFSLQKYEKERIQDYWMQNHIQKFPQNIISLYPKVQEPMRSKLVTLGIPLLIKFNIEEAIKFLNMVKNEAIFDFEDQTGHIFLELYRHNSSIGREFLRNINGWDLTHNSDVAISLLKAFRKLPLKKLLDIYQKFAANSDNLYREEICILLLSAIVHRKPARTFSLLKDINSHLSNKTIEKMMHNLVYQLCKTKLNLGKKLFDYLYQELQIKEFTIDIGSLTQIENAILACIKKDSSWHSIPEIYFHRWIAAPQLFAKLCNELLFYKPENAIRLSRYLVGKQEIFYVLGDVPFEITSEKHLDFTVYFSSLKTPSLSYEHKEKLLALILHSLPRFANLNEIFPYLLHPIWNRSNIVKIVSALPRDSEKQLSVSNFLLYVVLQEIEEFRRSRFESNFKLFIETFYKNEIEKIDLEKHLLPIFFRLLFFVDANFINEIWHAYWDQTDFISYVFVCALDSPKMQMEWIGKIISREDKVDAMEIIATNIIEKDFPSVTSFLEESVQLIDECGGLEYLYLRIPNVFIVLLEIDTEIAISLINRISDEEICTSAVEFALEYLSTARNFSKKMCKRIVPWLSNTSITNYIPANDLLYFYCQLTERMLEINCECEVKKMVNEILRLSKQCEDREKKYYLEDLISILIDKDLSLAYRVVQSYEDNEISFIEIVVAQSKEDSEKAIKMAKSHHSPEVMHMALEEMACSLAESNQEESLKILNLPELMNCGDTIWNALSISCAKRKKSPQDYIEKITNYNKLLKTYCDITAIYLQNGEVDDFFYYKQKIQEIIGSIQPSYNFLGLSLEWASGFPIEISIPVLTKISYLCPECALKLFYLYLEYDRFIDIDEIFQAIFRGVAAHYPDEILPLLKKINHFDMSNHENVLIEESKKDPRRTMGWLLQLEQTHLYPIVLDQIENEREFVACLELALEYNKNFSKQEYIEKLTVLIKYLFRIGGPFILFQIMEVLQIFSPPPYVSSTKELVENCIDICKKWEDEQKLQIRE